MKTIEENIKEAVRRALKDSGIGAQFGGTGIEDAKEMEVQLSSGEVLTVAYHPGLAPYQVPAALGRLRKEMERGQHPGFCVRRLSWSLLDKCRESKVAIFDIEGNAFVRLPGLYIERLRPSRQGMIEPSSGTVFTAKASRLVRAFLKRYPHDWSQAQLVQATGLSAGYVSTLTKRLSAQGYVRDSMGLLWLEDPERLLDDWLAHYRFDRHVKSSFAVSAGSYEEGVKKLHTALNESGVTFAWTGWTGAHLRSPHATPSLYMAYVLEMPKKLAGVFPVKGDGNVVLYTPHDAGVLQFGTETPSGPVVSDAQLYLDLCRMPGRAKEQAEAVRHARLDFARKVR